MKDPICGMDVPPGQAVAKENYRGGWHYFCSTLYCLRFQGNPVVHLGREDAPMRGKGLEGKTHG
jgi:YHS domain-containing protein